MKDAYEQYRYEFVSEETIEKARSMDIENYCDMCSHYTAPGFIINANQWIRCPQCETSNLVCPKDPNPINLTELGELGL